MNWRNLSILVTGGTGSFGKKFAEIMIKKYHPKRVVIFSRDELKQHEMRLSGYNHESLRYFIGDVRDVERLKRAMYEIDIVVHAAALKQVPACEYNPIEAVMTNVLGARNVIDAALDIGVKKVMALSTDKAVNPVNLYGATKLVAEKLFIQANAYSGDREIRFSCVRYGNVLGSRGSVIPTFLEQKKNGQITVTDPKMTRFWITLEQGVSFVIKCLEQMIGGEVFIPKIPSANIMDLVKVIAKGSKIQTIGIRPGEKKHEVLISENETPHTIELSDMFLIKPNQPSWKVRKYPKGKKLPEGYVYSSQDNPQKLSVKYLKKLLENPKDHEK